MIVSSPWVSRFKAASIPALVFILATPLILYKLYPPEIKDTLEAPAMAAKKLEGIGPVTRNKWIIVGTMLLAVSLWIFWEDIDQKRVDVVWSLVTHVKKKQRDLVMHSIEGCRPKKKKKKTN